VESSTVRRARREFKKGIEFNGEERL